MTKVDMNRTLREKTDFVDKIIQFKGIDPEKTTYLENIHQTNTNSQHINTTWEQSDDEILLDTTPDTPPPESDPLGLSSNPILHSTSHNSDMGRVSVNSSISTDSEGIPVNEQQQSSNKRIKIDNTSNIGKSSSNSQHPILSAESSNQSSASTSSTVKSSSQNTNMRSMSTISEPAKCFERERVPHSNIHQEEGTPIHRSYPNTDSYDPELLRLQNFTVKQLKNFLSAEAVNYDGLLEKHELYNKAKNLILDRRNNEKIMRQQAEAELKAQNLSGNSSGTPGLNIDVDKDVCKVCWDAAINCVLLECGHMCACITCSKKLLECPICRQNVVRAVHVFRV